MSYGWKALPVVAAHDGVVTKVTYDEGNAGCSVRIRGRDRWETRYYHLNNDIPGTDEIGFPCPAAGIEVGSSVSAGQLIGYVGDSGNAETTPPHVHFELRMPNGHPVDPYKSLRNAKQVTYEWLPSDFSVATLAIAERFDPDPASVTLVVTTDEAQELMSSEYRTMRLDAPIVAVDPQNPVPALAEISRIGSQAVVILSDVDVRWLEDLLIGNVALVETQSIPKLETQRVPSVPEALEEWEAREPNPTDVFATVIAGRIDKIWRSRVEPFEEFSAEHRSLVLVSESYGARYLGLRSTASPGRHADRDLLWWATGDGWIGTATIEEVPNRGYAYVTERLATPWTLAFLGSLAETPQVPRWKAK
ncbi:MAG: M23 family metallopeptidase [Actinomycetota bacterium]|nr:M23 family metallopeptidase [Actinomycetota bacterium]